jgi:anti-anti-sigma factor
MTKARLLAAHHEGVAQIRVLGLADYQVSGELRSFGEEMLEEGVRTFVVDLAECQQMDSTFIGVLALLGQESKHQATLILVNASQIHREALQKLGVKGLFTFSRRKSKETTWESICQAAADVGDISTVADTVLIAHKTLMAASPKNVPLFEDLVKILDAEVHPPTKPPKTDE